jgi:hypothetical protein
MGATSPSERATLRKNGSPGVPVVVSQAKSATPSSASGSHVSLGTRRVRMSR